MLCKNVIVKCYLCVVCEEKKIKPRVFRKLVDKFLCRLKSVKMTTDAVESKVEEVPKSDVSSETKNIVKTETKEVREASTAESPEKSVKEDEEDTYDPSPSTRLS